MSYKKEKAPSKLIFGLNVRVSNKQKSLAEICIQMNANFFKTVFFEFLFFEKSQNL